MGKTREPSPDHSVKGIHASQVKNHFHLRSKVALVTAHEALSESRRDHEFVGHLGMVLQVCSH